MVSEPYIKEFSYSQDGVNSINSLQISDNEQNHYIRNYPTVYVINDEKKDKYDVYVGETNNIVQRTLQHLNADPKNRDDWDGLKKSKNPNMYVIAHDHFNKSLTLDVENRLMLYLGSSPYVNRINNRRTNGQGEYFPVEELDEIFGKIWRKLNKRNQNLFPAMEVIKNEAIFKASPFHKLTAEQSQAKFTISNKIREILSDSKSVDEHLIMVTGDAGAGKTVLLSSLFYDLTQGDESRDVHLMVNHDEQIKVYQTISKKLGLDVSKVTKPTSFINKYSKNNKADVALVDEAHLLWTQGHLGYKGSNQLNDLLKRAKVVIAIFDANQILRNQQILSNEQIKKLREKALNTGDLIELHNQLRMQASDSTINWIKNLIEDQTIGILPEDDSYKVKVFDTPQQLEDAIDYENVLDVDSDYKNGISRLVATYDWPYVAKGKDVYKVKIGNWELPWNYQIKEHPKIVNYQDLSWTERPQTIKEVGSIYTIQGFDLNYVGVILGPSIKYRDGKIIFDKSVHFNKDVTNNRTMENGEKKNFGEELIKNEMNVLMTRGVHGLFIYAVDEALREKLKSSV